MCANRNSVFTNALAARGHNVTVISADREKNPPNGVHYIHMDGVYNKMYDEIIKSAFRPPHESYSVETSFLFSKYRASQRKGNLNIMSNEKKSYSSSQTKILLQTF